MKKKILVVDDSKVYQEVVNACLSAGGYQDILLAETGREAIEKTKRDRPDLVILDVMLPDLLGFEVCEKIKQIPEFLSKVILITGSVEAVDSRRARLSGADLFMVKTSDNSLMDCINEFFND